MSWGSLQVPRLPIYLKKKTVSKKKPVIRVQNWSEKLDRIVTVNGWRPEIWDLRTRELYYLGGIKQRC